MKYIILISLIYLDQEKINGIVDNFYKLYKKIQINQKIL